MAMCGCSGNVAANLLTRHVREAHANLLDLCQKCNPLRRQMFISWQLGAWFLFRMLDDALRTPRNRPA
jgi:hypothetical protein